ncbi:hypothetical protein Nepgr_017214 [Nepenthes gracilis]|uniref:Exostosin GT47 domain-containing protein n=1 Tax=Nepenthes gracilis TaxID=150966 RepID=A0AAD3XSA4_NEPGR|nr:hypothetical protein Nepgr_017214 [Nepenthes gracilis]
MATTAATTTFSLFLLLTVSLHTAAGRPSPYLSKTSMFPNYQKMMATFKIFIYPPNAPINFTIPALSLFYNSLLSSHLATSNPEEAHLFFVPFAPQSTRSLDRVVAGIRAAHPYWDRSLGADHFYLSCDGVGASSSRNVVELKKNSVQISCFPSPADKFIPHKDVTLPPLSLARRLPPAPENKTVKFVGYYRRSGSLMGSELINGLKNDTKFLIESEPSDETIYIKRLKTSKFCLYVLDEEMEGFPEALAHGCVPVVITDRPIQDLPFMDVLRWQDIALFVGTRSGVEGLKRVLSHTCGERYEMMRSSGVAAAQHFVWNASPKPYDAFNMLMYQLWLRRHAIRYARWQIA